MPRPRKGFAAHLERVEVIIEPELPAGHEGPIGTERRRCLSAARRHTGEVPHAVLDEANWSRCLDHHL